MQTQHYGFPYRNEEELLAAAAELHTSLPWSREVKCLAKPVAGQGFTLPNALAVHPMEGADGLPDGSPSELTIRRYKRFAAGGAGLIWLEAVCVNRVSRANPLQLMITRENTPAFRALAQLIVSQAEAACGHRPLMIVQLTHSGRWSKPVDKPAPIVGWHDEVLDRHQKLPPDYPVASDEELADLPAQFAQAAALCREAGFDGVDMKACHLYLYSELLGARDRPAPYGGTFEGRTKLFLDTTDAIRAAVGGDYLIASRLNVHDNTAGHFGNGPDGEPDLSEPSRLMSLMEARGVRLFNITMGTPYFNPHINRPYATGGYVPPEPPLRGVCRLQNGVRALQSEHPQSVCVGTGYSYLRHFAGFAAAGAVENGWARVAGFGRMAFACPDFAKQIVSEGAIGKNSACVACGKCTQLMRAGRAAGCPVRDQEVYLPLYRGI